MAAPRVKRDDSLRINMSTETKERLQRVADAFGMPPATIAALCHWPVHRPTGANTGCSGKHDRQNGSSGWRGAR